MPRTTNQFSTRASFFLPVALVLAMAAPAAAQSAGIRGGVVIDPDQVYVGGHFETTPLIDRVHFRPNVEVGFGDNLTHLGANLEFIYRFPEQGSWGLYAGGGPAANFYFLDDQPEGRDDTITEGGLNLLVGVENARGLFFEVKIGAVDSPDFKFGVGWSFR